MFLRFHRVYRWAALTSTGLLTGLLVPWAEGCQPDYDFLQTALLGAIAGLTGFLATNI